MQHRTPPPKRAAHTVPQPHVRQRRRHRRSPIRRSPHHHGTHHHGPSFSDELAVALHTIEDFGRSVQSADAKAGALAAVLGLVVGGLISAFTAPAAGVRDRSYLSGASGLAFALVVVSLAVAGVALGLTQFPRLTTAAGTGRLAFPEVARDVLGRRPISQLPDEAWSQARVLAAIALRKFRYLRIALPATGICTASFLCWLLLTNLAAQ